MSDTESTTQPRRLGTLALRWCGLAYACAVLCFTVGVWAWPVLLMFAVVATIVLGALFLTSAVLGMAAAALGLVAVYRGLFKGESAREALFGLLAVALCAGGPMSVWYDSGFAWLFAGFASLMWAVLEDIRDQPAPATGPGGDAPPGERVEP